LQARPNVVRERLCSKIAGSRRRRALLAICLGDVLGSQACLAQLPEELSVDVADCIRMESAAQRFRCYENKVDDALNHPQDIAASDGDRLAPIAEEPRAQPLNDSPSSRTEDRFFSEERRAERGEPIVFNSAISALRETVPDRYLITLENGQVWRQMLPKKYGLEVGQEVSIYSTRWGKSYRLTVENLGSFVQVERIR
jgi:hypothetical protein